MASFEATHRSFLAARAATLAITVCLFVPRLAESIQPRPQGHFLTNTELTNITAINCLQARQQDPSVVCEGPSELLLSSTLEELNAGSFPRYNDSICNSGGAFFCDPQGTLSSEEQAQVAGNLTRLRESVGVTCGRLQNDPVDRRHLQPFYLGVVILPSTWLSSESGPEALQTFGQIVAADWNMDSMWVGTPQPYLRCPTSAVLLVLPSARQAYLSSASCEFICSSRGGPEVVTATLVGLDHGGAARGVLAGIQAAYHALSIRPSAYDAPEALLPAGTPAATATRSRLSESNVSNALQRVLFVLAVLVFIASLSLGLVVMLLAPGLLPRRK
jgi:hypothetical protein